MPSRSIKQQRFYNGSKWHKCRNAFIAERMMIDGGLCMICHKEQGYIVHHRKHLNDSNIDDADISLNFSNLMYVCKPCHEIEHGYQGNKKTRQIIFDDNGQPKLYAPL